MKKRNREIVHIHNRKQKKTNNIIENMLHNFIQDNKVTLTYLTHHDLADTQKHI